MLFASSQARRHQHSRRPEPKQGPTTRAHHHLRHRCTVRRGAWAGGGNRDDCTQRLPYLRRPDYDWWSQAACGLSYRGDLRRRRSYPAGSRRGCCALARPPRSRRQAPGVAWGGWPRDHGESCRNHRQAASRAARGCEGTAPCGCHGHRGKPCVQPPNGSLGHVRRPCNAGAERLEGGKIRTQICEIGCPCRNRCVPRRHDDRAATARWPDTQCCVPFLQHARY
jgi:hypothetical protein